MKRLLLVVLVLASGAARADWLSSGVIVNPLLATVILDSGPLPGPYTIQFCAQVSASVAAQVVIQLRDASNTTTISSQMVSVLASGYSVFCTSNSVTIPDGGRLRIVNQGTLLGALSVGMTW